MDLVDNRVLVHEQPAGDAYARITTLRRGDTVQISAGDSRMPFAVDRLLP